MGKNVESMKSKTALLSQMQLKTRLSRGMETKSNATEIGACNCKDSRDMSRGCNVVYRGNVVSQEQPQERVSVV